MPALTGEQLVAFVPEVAQVCHVEVSQVMNVDSTNMRPEGWLAIAGEVRRGYDDFDGFAVLHGTDTLAYTAAGLSYLVQGRPKPIVLTGSQLPMGDPGTDGKRNLLDAVRVACDDAAAGVMVAFGGKVISGTAARKVRTRSFEAFDSLNALDLGRVRDGRVTWADGALRSDEHGPECGGETLMMQTRGAYAHPPNRSLPVLRVRRKSST